MINKIDKEITMVLPNSILKDFRESRKNNVIKVFEYVDNKTR